MNEAPFEPAYLALARRGELARRAALALERLVSCDLCPHGCGVDRTAGERGMCRTGRSARVASAGPHYGEEAPLVGRGGSGTVFFACCNLRCLFCQNADISQADHGEDLEADELAALMLQLQRGGCENINLVSPSHVIAQVLEALLIAAAAGLSLPLVYNTGGYDAVDALELLDGVVDIYMPDLKYADETIAARLSGPADYVARNRAAVREMHRQVGDLALDDRGVARRGLLVRHLVLPDDRAGTRQVVEFIARKLSPGTYVNIMDQYRPRHRAAEAPEIDRGITAAEYRAALDAAHEAGLTRLDRPRRQPGLP